MKKTVLTLAIMLGLTNLHAQTAKEENNETNYNKWSIEVAGGFNKPQRPFTSTRYYSDRISPYTVDLGVRYMFNNKFGLKVDAGYNNLSGQNNSSIDFDSKYYRADLQAVANLGRIMNFETWTKTIGLLAHAGFGVAQLESKNFHGKDQMGNLIAGFTGQIRLSDRFALTGDITTIANAYQDRTFDGNGATGNRGFSGLMFNGTVGLNYYLGKQTKHADWVVIEQKSAETDLSGLQAQITNLEAKLNAKTAEPKYVEKEINYEQLAATSSKETIKKMINDGYIGTYFEFNKSTPTDVSTYGIDFILSYLRNNPTASVDIIGHADEIGSSAYNTKLSDARANNVKYTLEKANIASSRLNVVAAGSDTSVDKTSEGARMLTRRVTFKVK